RDAWFDGAKISGNAVFGKAKISRDAWFDRAKISGNAVFGKAKISRDAWFGEAEISGNAEFGEAEISGDAVFGKAKISGNVLLEGLGVLGILNVEGLEVADRSKSHELPPGWRIEPGEGTTGRVVAENVAGS
ncbi:pentapeptide repeat-containing protein, partial [Actinomadura kijaniata]|uniref:pentapeptide repeat-containing protein n=1 Tax=Actinomadura kijaniata TaxID=46161 RepID=UPI003F1C1CF5